MLDRILDELGAGTSVNNNAATMCNSAAHQAIGSNASVDSCSVMLFPMQSRLTLPVRPSVSASEFLTVLTEERSCP